MVRRAREAQIQILPSREIHRKILDQSLSFSLAYFTELWWGSHGGGTLYAPLNYLEEGQDKNVIDLWGLSPGVSQRTRWGGSGGTGIFTWTWRELASVGKQDWERALCLHLRYHLPKALLLFIPQSKGLKRLFPVSVNEQRQCGGVLSQFLMWPCWKLVDDQIFKVKELQIAVKD